MNQISNILEMHDTDKHNNTEHSYGGFYENLFSQYDRMGKLNILELGVQRGGSLYAWQEYFPNAKITGVDIVDDRLEKYKTNENITFIHKDLHLAFEDLKEEKFDIIIDDSDHNELTMSWILRHYYDLLKPKGTLVFEDCQIPDLYIKTLMASIPKGANLNSFDMRDIKPRHDDFIITVTKI